MKILGRPGVTAGEGRSRPGLRGLLRRTGAVAVGSAMALAALPALPAAADFSAVGPVDGTTQFPAWYSDGNGLQLQPCLDGGVICLSAAADLTPPDGEGFYWAADATAGVMNLHLALEMAYAGAGPGQEVTFQRTQVSARGGLGGGQTYTITDPYGTLTCTATGTGTIPNNGCRTETLPVPGNFTNALTGRLGPFLTWDTFGSTAGAPPAGYIGDNATPHAVVGSPTGFNTFRVEGPGINDTGSDACPTVVGPISDCIETSEFVVQGKVIAGPVASVDPTTFDFGHQQQGTSSVAKTFTVTSKGTAAVEVSSITLGGTASEDYAINNETCTAATVTGGVAPGSTCSFDVTFTPTLARNSSATITVVDNTAASPRTISVRGTTAAAVSLNPTSIAFPSQKRLTGSVPETVTVTNSGSADLTINSIVLTGTGAGQFGITANTCSSTGVPMTPGTSCTVDVRFAPTATGLKTANLTVTDAGGAHNVALSGNGTAPTASLSPASLGFANQTVGTTSSQSFVNVNNGGNANLVIQNVSFGGANSGDFRIGGTNSCTSGANVAPGSACVVGVTFAPSAANARSATLVVNSDAGAAESIPLSGTGTAPADAQPPTVPTGLSARGVSTSQIDLSWSASTDNVGVTSYRIFRDGATTATGISTGTTFSDTGLAASSTHSYRVAAVDAAGNQSLLSNSVSATTAAAPDTVAPSAPAALSATAAGSSQINLSWSASTDNVGVTSYRIFRDGATTATGTSTGTTFSDTGLAASSTHSYTVRGVDAAGNVSGPSPVASATTTAALTAPGAPTGVSGTPGDTQVTVRWTAPTNVGSGITGYQVQAFVGTATTAVKTREVTGTGTSYVFTTLTNGTAYQFVVRARTGTAPNTLLGAASTRSASVTPGALPGAAIIRDPTAGSTTDGTIRSATAKWTNPTNTGGSALTRWRITAINASTNAQIGQKIATGTGLTSFKYEGLVNGSRVKFRVEAGNAVGFGPSSAISTLSALVQ